MWDAGGGRILSEAGSQASAALGMGFLAETRGLRPRAASGADPAD
jgi:hypothetical protein